MMVARSPSSLRFLSKYTSPSTSFVLRTSAVRRFQSNQAIADATTPADEKWRLVICSLIARLPYVTPDPTPVERELILLKRKREEELAKLKNVDVMGEFGPKGKVSSEKERRDRARFFPDPSVERPREAILSQADLKNDKRSVERYMDKHLYLMVKAKGAEGKWMLPSAELMEGETCRKTARRGIFDTYGTAMDVYYWGHAPFQYLEERDESNPPQLGTKTFYMFGTYVKGNGKLNQDKYDDWAWLTREEVRKVLEPKHSKALDNLLQGNWVY